MKILHIPHTYAPNTGGTEYFCGRLSEELVAQGHEVEVLAPDAPYYRALFELGYTPLAAPRRETINGVKVTRIPFCSLPSYRLGSQTAALLKKLPWQRPYWYLTYTLARKIGEGAATAFIEQEIERIKPDVVVTLAHMLPNMQWVLDIHKRHALPLVQLPLIHYNVPHEYGNEFGVGLRQGKATVTLTHTEAEVVKTHYRLPAESVFVGAIGTDIPATLPPKGDDNGYVLFLSRKEPYKGVEATIAAMRHVWKVQPHLKLILAGPRTTHSDFLDPLLATLTPAERANITEVGHISQAEKERLLRDALCLVFASESESFGLVLIEAMAYGIPPVTWDVPLFRETVLHNETGLLAENQNNAALAEAILQFAADPALVKQLGEQGRERVKTHYRWEVVAQNYLRAYEYAQHRS